MAPRASEITLTADVLDYYVLVHTLEMRILEPDFARTCMYSFISSRVSQQLIV